jgi:hypothetical protein
MIWMRGAQKRDRLALAIQARATWVGFNVGGTDLDDYLRALIDPASANAPQSPDVAMGILRAASAAVPAITMAEALRRMH